MSLYFVCGAIKPVNSFRNSLSELMVLKRIWLKSSTRAPSGSKLIAYTPLASLKSHRLFNAGLPPFHSHPFNPVIRS